MFVYEQNEIKHFKSILKKSEKEKNRNVTVNYSATNLKQTVAIKKTIEFIFVVD